MPDVPPTPEAIRAALSDAADRIARDAARDAQELTDQPDLATLAQSLATAAKQLADIADSTVEPHPSDTR